MRPVEGLVLGGRYRLTRRIAVGGMGEVWVAQDDSLGRDVAVKVLRTEYAGNEDFLQRLRTEARNSARLTHSGIAQMYDYGEQEGSGFLVMELVLGEPMSDLLEREPVVPLHRLLPILSQAARALHAAHVAGVVHRDVKPGNILLDRSGDVKLTDFGVSLAANQVPMTATGMVMGTAQYLSPEQAVGRAATPSSDVYALGIVAYESLAGKRPFTGATPVDIAVAHVNQPVPPLPAHVDRELGSLVLRTLAKDPAERPRTAAALAQAIDAIEARLQRERSRVSPRPVASVEVPGASSSPAGRPADEPAGSRTYPPRRVVQSRAAAARAAHRVPDAAPAPTAGTSPSAAPTTAAPTASPEAAAPGATAAPGTAEPPATPLPAAPTFVPSVPPRQAETPTPTPSAARTRAGRSAAGGLTASRGPAAAATPTPSPRPAPSPAPRSAPVPPPPAADRADRAGAAHGASGAHIASGSDAALAPDTPWERPPTFAPVGRPVETRGTPARPASPAGQPATRRAVREAAEAEAASSRTAANPMAALRRGRFPWPFAALALLIVVLVVALILGHGQGGDADALGASAAAALTLAVPNAAPRPPRGDGMMHPTQPAASSASRATTRASNAKDA